MFDCVTDAPAEQTILMVVSNNIPYIETKKNPKQNMVKRLIISSKKEFCSQFPPLSKSTSLIIQYFLTNHSKKLILIDTYTIHRKYMQTTSPPFKEEYKDLTLD
jgi:hypothetical protein